MKFVLPKSKPKFSRKFSHLIKFSIMLVNFEKDLFLTTIIYSFLFFIESCPNKYYSDRYTCMLCVIFPKKESTRFSV